MNPVRENITIRDGGSFACLEFRGEVFDCPYHFHPEIEITWIVAGKGQRLVGDNMGDFSPGDLVMHGEGLPHMYRNWAPDFAHSRYIQFRREAFGAEFFRSPEFRAIDHLFQRASRGLVFGKRSAQKASAAMEVVFAHPAGPKRVAAFLELLAILAADPEGKSLAGIDYSSQNDPATSETARRILIYIEENWNETVCLKEAARAAGLHPRSLSRFFRRRMGKTFREYLVELRLGRVARELIESDRGISEIAFACGFNNLSNFNRLFLQKYDLSPGVYRRRSR
jgi:AraC-like DNA-binding protein